MEDNVSLDAISTGLLEAHTADNPELVLEEADDYLYYFYSERTDGGMVSDDRNYYALRDQVHVALEDLAEAGRTRYTLFSRITRTPE